MKTGLTLGKFAPLHKGHQLLIETALREMDRVIVMVLDASDTNLPLPVRANWIRTLYPTVEVLEVGDTSTVLSLLASQAITHVYGAGAANDVSRSLGAMHRSLTIAAQESVDPVVYRDLLTHVVFVGAPSTGKTTLARTLAARYGTVWVPEYGREYWERHHVDRRLTLEQLVEIGEGQREREDAVIMGARRFLFVDTEAIVTRVFSLHYYGRCDPRLDALADESARRYDLFFLCADDIPYHDTPERSGETNRALFQQWICSELGMRKIPYITIGGPVDERLARVTATLERFRKFGSVVSS
jgi:HTH-type transcriptional repressor of NAD biosynthesis genes